MALLKKLSISGVRSYSNTSKQQLQFFIPLTMIWGHNGAGKTTILQSIKYVITGIFPPYSQHGKSFVLDPNIVNKGQIISEIILQFSVDFNKQAYNGHQIIIQKKFGANKKKFETFQQHIIVIELLSIISQQGQKREVNHNTSEWSKQVPNLLGASKQLIDNVILCHQQNSLWPFEENMKLKQIFDELFNTQKYMKNYQYVFQQQKQIKNQIKKYQTKLQISQNKYNYKVKENLQKIQQIRKSYYQIKEKIKKCQQIPPFHQNKQLKQNLAYNQFQLKHIIQNFKDLQFNIIDENFNIEQNQNLIKIMKNEQQSFKSQLEIITNKLQVLKEIQKQQIIKQNKFSQIKKEFDIVIIQISKFNIQLNKENFHSIYIQDKKSKLLQQLNEKQEVMKILNRKAIQLQIRSNEKNIYIQKNKKYQYLNQQIGQYRKHKQIFSKQLIQIINNCYFYLEKNKPSSFNINIDWNQEVNLQVIKKDQQLKQKYDDIFTNVKFLEKICTQFFVSMKKNVITKRICVFCQNQVKQNQIIQKIDQNIKNYQNAIQQLQQDKNKIQQQRIIIQNQVLKAHVYKFIQDQKQKFHSQFSFQQYTKAQLVINSVINKLKFLQIQFYMNQTISLPNFNNYQKISELSYTIQKLHNKIEYLNKQFEQINIKEYDDLNFQESNSKYKYQIQINIKQKQQQIRKIQEQLKLFSKLNDLILQFNRLNRNDLENKYFQMDKLKKEKNNLQQMLNQKIKNISQLLIKQKYYHLYVKNKQLLKLQENQRRHQSKNRTKQLLQKQIQSDNIYLQKQYKNLKNITIKNQQNQYFQCLIKLKIYQKIFHDLNIYLKSLENSLLQFHSQKINSINKIIKDLWRDIYQGSDIQSIFVKSQLQQVGIVNQKQIQLRGRCSMGQKVLASLIVRLALAQSFAINCNIFALDEPTTNLDSEHIQKLANELSRLIYLRKLRQNFQLIIITHDKQFIKKMSIHSEYCYKITRNSKHKFSQIIKLPLEQIIY